MSPSRAKRSLSLLGGGAGRISGSSSGVLFAFAEANGERRVDPLWPGDCKERVLGRDGPLVLPIGKSGAATDEFSNWFLRDPVVRLPAGEWEIKAIADFNEGLDCNGRQHTLEATVRVRVVDD